MGEAELWNRQLQAQVTALESAMRTQTAEHELHNEALQRRIEKSKEPLVHELIAEAERQGALVCELKKIVEEKDCEMAMMEFSMQSTGEEHKIKLEELKNQVTALECAMCAQSEQYKARIAMKEVNFQMELLQSGQEDLQQRMRKADDMITDYT